MVVLPQDSAEQVRAFVDELQTYVDFRGYEESLPLARASLSPVHFIVALGLLLSMANLWVDFRRSGRSAPDCLLGARCGQ